MHVEYCKSTRNTYSGINQCPRPAVEHRQTTPIAHAQDRADEMWDNDDGAGAMREAVLFRSQDIR